MHFFILFSQFEKVFKVNKDFFKLIDLFLSAEMSSSVYERIGQLKNSSFNNV
jgi:hypothetical protein